MRKHDSEGRRLLLERFAVRGEQARVARETGSDPGHLSHIANGKTRPGLELALKLQRLCGIPAESWQQKAARGRGRRRNGTTAPIKSTGT